MTLKEAAAALIKVADQIDAEAMTVTEFVCKGCNHTATLASINSKRKTAAKEAGENVSVADITVNDQIHCPACNDIMAYRPTEASEQFYFDPDKKAAEEEKKPEEAKKEDKKDDKKEEVMASKKAEDEKKEEKEDDKEDDKDDKEASKKASIDYDSLKRYTK
jgi:hypothetical protein